LISFLLLHFCFINEAKAQKFLPDVPAAFNAISTTPRTIHLKRNHIKIPAGGHFQGIQALSDSLFVITASSASYAYYITTNQKAVTSLRKLSDSPFRHAGGCQVFGDHLEVGVEDNHAKDKSNIVDLLLDKKGTELSSGIVVERKGIFKRSTAGAVGAIFTDTNYNWVLAVADWDSRNIDFYYSEGDNIVMTDSATTLVVPSKHKWCAYQSINLIQDTTGKIYLVGFGLDGLRNRADLFEVKIESHQANLRLLSTRIFKCKAHAGFRYASGIGVSAENKLTIYSYGMKLNAAINIFQ
jgi:hypothetical protein